MTIHIGAIPGDIAETVLMPGDPLRAKYVAETFLKDARCYSEVRGMYGFTGTYNGKNVSVQGSGMGMPSISIYTNELISTYGAKNLIRIGSCGSLQENVKLRDVVIAQGACTDSSINRIPFQGMDYAPIADFGLLKKAYDVAEEKRIGVHVGNILSTDVFYDEAELWKTWAKFNVLAVEMEAAALYTLGAKFGVATLAVCTVSDHLVSGEACTSEERQTTFDQMVEIALELA
jgi:purine-nucleoside phosphorylase